jgi:rhamnosyltransferase
MQMNEADLPEARIPGDPEGSRMSIPRVCAVVVTYHPGIETVANLSKIRAQVTDLVIIDNHSNEDSLHKLRQAREITGFALIENADNAGVAQALNQGVKWARSKAFPWVILFDQDSPVDEGFVEQMFATWNSHPERARIASIQPTYKDPQTGTEVRVRRARDGGPVTALTSGSLMPAWIFDDIGYFAAEYFIDCVDIEYCLRIRAAGYIIADSREAVLAHTPGSPKPASILGFCFQPTHHSAVRRYYMSRNRTVVFRKYFSIFPGWILQLMYDSSRETVKCFLAERDRARKFRNFLLGVLDGLTGRMGKRSDL